MNEFFTAYLDSILTFITGGGLAAVLAVKYTRKTAQADAMKAVQDVYQETIQDLRTDKEIMKKENLEMKGQISSLEKIVEQNCADIRELKTYKCIVVDCKNRKKE